MPIDDDIKDEYPDNWEDVQDEILERASWVVPPGEDNTAVQTTPRCESCGKPNGKTVVKGPGGRWVDEYWIDHPLGPDRPVWRDADGEVLEETDWRFGDGMGEVVGVVLTLSHACHDPRCDHREHLDVLCQFCHLQRDGTAEARETQRKVKAEIRGQQSLFGGGGCVE